MILEMLSIAHITELCWTICRGDLENCIQFLSKLWFCIHISLKVSCRHVYMYCLVCFLNYLFQLLKEPFDVHIKRILKHNVSQPILKLGPNANPSAQECMEVRKCIFKVFNVPVFLSITVTPSVKLQVQHAVCQFFHVIWIGLLLFCTMLEYFL